MSFFNIPKLHSSGQWVDSSLQHTMLWGENIEVTFNKADNVLLRCCSKTAIAHSLAFEYFFSWQMMFAPIVAISRFLDLIGMLIAHVGVELMGYVVDH